MSGEEITQLDALIVQEKRNIARAQLAQMWESAIDEGIEVDILAEEIVTETLTELTRAHGPERVREFIDQISKRDNCGDFLPEKSLQ